MLAHIIVALLLALTLGVLIAGVVTMARGGSGEKQNRLMMWRVALQGVTLLLLGIMFLISGK